MLHMQDAATLYAAHLVQCALRILEPVCLIHHEEGPRHGAQQRSVLQRQLVRGDQHLRVAAHHSGGNSSSSGTTRGHYMRQHAKIPQSHSRTANITRFRLPQAGLQYLGVPADQVVPLTMSKHAEPRPTSQQAATHLEAVGPAAVGCSRHVAAGHGEAAAKLEGADDLARAAVTHVHHGVQLQAVAGV